MAKKDNTRIWIVAIILLVIAVKAGVFETQAAVKIGDNVRYGVLSFQQITCTLKDATLDPRPEYNSPNFVTWTTKSGWDPAPWPGSGYATTQFNVREQEAILNSIDTGCGGVGDAIWVKTSTQEQGPIFMEGNDNNVFTPMSISPGSSVEVRVACFGFTQGAPDTTKIKLNIVGKVPNLYYGNPQQFVEAVRVPGTEYCVKQTGLQFNTNEIAQKMSVVDRVTNSVSGLFYDQNRDKIPDSNVQSNTATTSSYLIPPSIGQSILMPFVWTEVASPACVFTDSSGNKFPCVCDPQTYSVYGFTKTTAYNGQEWALADTSQQFLKYTASDQVQRFACSATQCRNDDVWSATDFLCKSRGANETVVKGACLTAAECVPPNQVIPEFDSSGKVIYYKFENGQCVGGLCDFDKVALECNPFGGVQADGSCCKLQADGNWRMDTSCTKPGAECPEGQCCFSSNTQSYSAKSCDGEDLCCGAEGDGVGVCAKSCEPDQPGILDKISSFLEDLFGVTAATAKILLWILLIAGIIFILYLIRGKGGSGGSSGGTPIIIFNK